MFGRKRKEEKQLKINTNIPNKLEAIIVRKINDTYMKIGSQKIKPTDTILRFRSGNTRCTFTIPKNLEVCYTDGKRSYIFLDYDSGILDFNKTSLPIDIEELDDLIGKNIVAGIFNGIKGALESQNMIGGIFKYLMIAIGCGAIGYIVRDVIAQEQTVVVAQMILGVI